MTPFRITGQDRMAHERDRIPTHRQDRDDLALVDAARREPAAFGALYDRHVDRVFAYALRRLRDRELAADATANAFTRALASPDHSKLRMAGTTCAAGETSLWVDLATGEIRELPGRPGRLFNGQVPGVASTVNRYVGLDDLESKIRIVDMATGTVARTVDRIDTSAITIAPSGAIVAIPRKEGVDLADLAAGRSAS
jgi:hypothetical protein